MDETTAQEFIDGVLAGQPQAVAQLFAPYSGRLTRLIALRLDRRIAGRVSIEDILQEVYVAACRQLPQYTRRSQIPFYVWLRAIAVHKLLEVHRYHLATQQRDARREMPLQVTSSDASSQVLANFFVDSGTSPSRALMLEEMKSRLKACLDQLPAIDKEILALRHFEQLSPAETAHVLQLTEKAAGMRYTRALRKLRSVFDGLGDGSSAWYLNT